jgi:hypothetical protein
MSCLLLPINSCSITWRDPSSTSPQGRLQADLRLYPLGGLKEFCDDDDCNQVGRGIGICLHGVDQTKGENPPEDYVNPLAMTEDGCIWFKGGLGCFQFNSTSVKGTGNLPETAESFTLQCVTGGPNGDAIYVSLCKPDGSVEWVPLVEAETPEVECYDPCEHTHNADTGAVEA